MAALTFINTGPPPVCQAPPQRIVQPHRDGQTVRLPQLFLRFPVLVPATTCCTIHRCFQGARVEHGLAASLDLVGTAVTPGAGDLVGSVLVQTVDADTLS